MAQLANPSTIDLNSLVNLFTGKSGSSSTSSTTSSNISKEGMDALVKQILESDAGVANILSGPKKAGIYNSSTTQQLLGDFAARAAGELAVKQAGTTTSSNTNQSTDAALNPIKTAGTIGLASLLAPTVTRGLAEVGISGGIGGVGKSLADLLFGPVQDAGYNPATVEIPTELRGSNGYEESATTTDEFVPADDYSWLYDQS